MFFKTVIVALLLVAARARILFVKNIASVPLVVSITGQDDVPILAGATAPVTVGDDFSGTISAIRNDSERTDIPRTKVELALSATQDSYSISLIDGFNLKAKIVPIQGTNCSAAVCSADLISNCPVENQVLNSLGVAVACNNSPVVFRRVCPKAVVGLEDAINVLTCQAVSYSVFLG